MRKKSIIFFATLLVSFFIFYGTANAGLVPCGMGSDVANACNLCHLVVGFHHIVTYARNIATVVALACLVFAGIMYMVSSGNESLMTSAKNFMKVAVVGFAIVFASWLVVNTVLWLISSKTGTSGYNLGVKSTSWNTFSCNAGIDQGSGDGGGAFSSDPNDPGNAASKYICSGGNTCVQSATGTMTLDECKNSTACGAKNATCSGTVNGSSASGTCIEGTSGFVGSAKCPNGMAMVVGGKCQSEYVCCGAAPKKFKCNDPTGMSMSICIEDASGTFNDKTSCEAACAPVPSVGDSCGGGGTCQTEAIDPMTGISGCPSGTSMVSSPTIDCSRGGNMYCCK